MSIASVVATSFYSGPVSGAALTDSAALALFIAGGVSLAFAFYLLAKAPRGQAVRVARRR